MNTLDYPMSESDVTINPRKTPLQSRSRDTFLVILQAALELLDRSGLESFNTNEIANRAGVSVGSLYQYFPNKNAILTALIREMRKNMRNDFKRAIDHTEGQKLEVCLNALIHASLNHHLDNPARTEILEQAEESLPLDEDTQLLKSEMSSLIVTLLKKHEIKLPEQTAFDLIALSHGLAQAATRSGQTNLDNLSKRIERAVFGYLSLDPQ